MIKCERCGVIKKSNGMVTVTSEEDKMSETMCRDCYNTCMAEMLGMEYDNEFEKEVAYTDCEGIEHHFEIRKQIFPMGICWEANEFLLDDKIGYAFKVHQHLDMTAKEQ